MIDDDAAIRESITRAVAASGLNLELADSWEAGLEAFFALGPELVVADYNLPGSEMGLELLLRVARARPSVRLILFSAFLTDDDAEEILAVGPVDRVLSKKDPMFAAKEILAEIANAKLRSQMPTDWVAFSRASLDRHDVDEEAFRNLDRILRRDRLTGEK
ncbi:response regulator [Agromyces laixinhei]|uniref:response regulator n=1 Tax=Agromyces laixinhei TaxID=2585717 RepID=UPI0018DECB8A|nr:response regulator [Agromyces laixinhei]